jgi:hypothetical protein
MQGNGGGGRGTTAHYIQLNKQIMDGSGTGELCQLIGGALSADWWPLSTRRTWQTRCGRMRVLEGRAEALAGTFDARTWQTLWGDAGAGGAGGGRWRARSRRRT